MSDAERPDASPQNVWKRRAVLGALIVAGVVVAFVIATSFLPRWWSHRAGSLSKETFRWGVWWGLVFGFVCTLVPLFVIRYALTNDIRWKVRGWIIAGAVLIAAPNLMTLGIVLGSGDGAHAGERTMDTDAPGFRGATLVGVVLAVVGFIVIEVFLSGRRRRGRELTQLRIDKKIRDAKEGA